MHTRARARSFSRILNRGRPSAAGSPVTPGTPLAGGAGAWGEECATTAARVGDAEGAGRCADDYYDGPAEPIGKQEPDVPETPAAPSVTLPTLGQPGQGAAVLVGAASTMAKRMT